MKQFENYMFGFEDDNCNYSIGIPYECESTLATETII